MLQYYFLLWYFSIAVMVRILTVYSLPFLGICKWNWHRNNIFFKEEPFFLFKMCSVRLYCPSKNIASLSFYRTGFCRAADARCYSYLSATLFYFDSTCKCNRLQVHLFKLALMHKRNYKMKQVILMETYEYESNFFEVL